LKSAENSPLRGPFLKLLYTKKQIYGEKSAHLIEKSFSKILFF
jgi:hypothetical protein